MSSLSFELLIQDNPERTERYYNEAALDSVLSVDDAVYKVLSNPSQRTAIVNRVLNDKIRGNADQFHLLIELNKHYRDYELAYNLCRYAIGLTDSPLLYTDIIEISTNFDNPIHYGDAYIKRILDDPQMQLWDLRLFWAVYNYFFKLVDDNRINGIREEFYEKAIDTAAGMQKYFKAYEDGYFAEANLLICAGKRERAKRKLEEWIFTPIDAEIDPDHYLRCPKCCILWLKNFREYSLSLSEMIVDKGYVDSEDDADKRYFLAQKTSIARHRATHNVKGVEDDDKLKKYTSQFTIEINISSKYRRL